MTYLVCVIYFNLTLLYEASQHQSYKCSEIFLFLTNLSENALVTFVRLIILRSKGNTKICAQYVDFDKQYVDFDKVVVRLNICQILITLHSATNNGLLFSNLPKSCTS